MTLSPLDDYPIHQVPQVMRHVGTSDRNFYDRYYFNCFRLDPADTMLIIGLAQYPNLGVADAFALLRRGSLHRVVRASRELGVDRMDTTVGPFSVTVLEGLRRLRVRLEDTGHGLAFDLTWDGAIPAQLEPRHFVRQHERVLFDSIRLAQTGGWSGQLSIDGDVTAVVPEQWWGSRDRSWGIRPVGEPEPPGIRGADPPQFYWVYAPMRFDDFSILTVLQESAAGERLVDGATRVFPDGRVEPLGSARYEPDYAPGTRDVVSATLSYPAGPTVRVEPLLDTHLLLGTGYGLEADWRHGMYQGPDPVVQAVDYDLDAPDTLAWGLVDAVARVTCDGQVGYGLFEHWALGTHTPSGLK